jgi:hypothetical protein
MPVRSSREWISSKRHGGHGGETIVKEFYRNSFGLLITILVFTGCSATSPLVSEWRNPDYGSVSFKRIMVGGVGGSTSVRRNFEDEFVTQLRTTGIDAVPSYREMSDSEQVDEANRKRAAQKAGADGAILVRSIQVEEKRQYGPSYYPAPWFGFYGPHFGASWYGLYGAPSVYHYNEYTSETTAL